MKNNNKDDDFIKQLTINTSVRGLFGEGGVYYKITHNPTGIFAECLFKQNGKENKVDSVEAKKTMISQIKSKVENNECSK